MSIYSCSVLTIGNANIVKMKFLYNLIIMNNILVINVNSVIGKYILFQKSFKLDEEDYVYLLCFPIFNNSKSERNLLLCFQPLARCSALFNLNIEIEKFSNFYVKMKTVFGSFMMYTTYCMYILMTYIKRLVFFSFSITYKTKQKQFSE